MNCINTKHPEFVKLVEETGIPSMVLEFVIKDWQGKNTDKVFPNTKEAMVEYKLWNNKSQPTIQTSKVKEGVSKIFNENLELATIGSEQEYSNYLDTVFPESKVKDIVYHGVIKGKKSYESILKNGFNFEISRNWDSKNSKLKGNSGMFFSDKGTALSYGVNLDRERFPEQPDHIIPAILNIEYLDTSQATSSSTANKFYKDNKDKKNIGMFGLEGGSEGVHDNHVVFESEQIHILGSKKDAQGFKKFVNKSKQQTSEVKAVEEMPTIHPDYFNKDVQLDGTYTKESIKTKLAEDGSESTKFMLNLVFNNISDNLSVEIVDEILDEKGKLANGIYDPTTNTIKIAKYSPNMEATVLHELLHAATVKIIAAYRAGTLSAQDHKTVMNIEALYNRYKRAFRNDGTQATEDIEEFITGIFTNAKVQRNADSLSYRQDKMSLLEKFFKQLMSLFGFDANDNTVLTSAMYNTMFLLENLQSDLTNTQPSKIFSELSQEEYDTLTSQYTSEMPLVQKQTAEELMVNSSLFTLTDDEKNYKDTDNVEYMRTGTWYQQTPGYEFTGDKAKYEKNRAWGNQIDMILEGILLEKSLGTIKEEIDGYLMDMPFIEDSFILEDEILAKAYNYYSKWVQEKKDEGFIVLPQITAGNKSPVNSADNNAVAGTFDILLIDSKGKIDIVDLKSSIYSVYPDESGEYKYERDFGDSKSTRKRHSMQLGAYKGILFSKNHLVGSTSILPVKLVQKTDPLTGEPIGEIEDIIFEELLPVIANKDAVQSLAVDGIGVSSYNESKGYDSLLESITTLLTNKVTELINNGKKTFFIENLKEELDQREPILAIEHFINDTAAQFYGPDNKKFLGYFQRMNNIAKNKNLTASEKINELEEIQDLVLMYKESLQGLRKDYTKLILEGEIEENETDTSSRKKLRDLVSEAEDIELQLNKILAPLQSEILAGVTDTEFSKSAQEQINKLEKKLEILKKAHTKSVKDGAKPRIINRQKVKIAEIKETIAKLTEQAKVSKKDLTEALQNGSREDMGFFEYWTRPFISSTNKIVATVARKIKAEFEKARLTSWNESLIFTKAFENFEKASDVSRDNVEEFNKKFYSKVKTEDKDGVVREIYVLKSDTNYAKYESNRLAAKKQTLNMDPAAARKYMSDWYKNNTESIPENNVYVTNPITGEKTIFIKGKKELIAEKKKKVSEKEFSFWLNKMNKSGAFSMPATALYKQDLNLNAAEKEYHDTLMYYMFEANKELPNQGQMYKLQLPSITKNSNDRVRENGITDYFKYNYTNATEEVEEDIEIYGETNFSIPIMYRQAMSIEDVSLDLGASVMRFYDASQKYKSKKEMFSLLKSVLNNAKAAKPAKSTSRGLVKDYMAKQAGIDANELIENGGYISLAIEKMINVHIYNKTKERANVGNVDVNKVTGTLMGFQSFTSIGGNPLLSLANGLMGNMSNLIEAAGGRHFSIKNWVKSQGIYFANQGKFMADFSSPVNKSKLGQLFDVYDAIQGEYQDKFGRKLTMSAARKAFSTDTWFYLQHKTEHQIQGTALIAKLLSTPVTINGKESTLYDAYQLKDGKLSIKKGTIYNGTDISNEVMLIDVQNQIHSVNKDLQGVYNNFDKPLVERYWWGGLLMMYRKFIVPGVVRRFGNTRVDFESGEVKEGYYKTFWNLMLEQFDKDMRRSYKDLTKLEQENLKRASMDFGIAVVLSVLIGFLTAAAEGGDDDDLIYYVLYPMYRLRAELRFFYNPLDFGRTLRTPTIAYSMVEKVMRVGTQMFNPFETYDRAYGFAEKGDYKLPYKFLKAFLGLNGSNFNPDEAFKIIKMQTN